MTSQEHVASEGMQEEPVPDQSGNVGGSQSSSSQSYKKNYTYEDWLREQAEEAQREARKAASPNLAVSSLPAFASLEDVLVLFCTKNPD